MTCNDFSSGYAPLPAQRKKPRGELRPKLRQPPKRSTSPPTPNPFMSAERLGFRHPARDPLWRVSGTDDCTQKNPDILTSTPGLSLKRPKKPGLRFFRQRRARGSIIARSQPLATKDLNTPTSALRSGCGSRSLSGQETKINGGRVRQGVRNTVQEQRTAALCGVCREPRRSAEKIF